MVGRNFIENKLSKNYHLIAPTKKELNLLDFEKVNSFIFRNKVDFILHAAGRVGDSSKYKRTSPFFTRKRGNGENIVLAKKQKN